MECAAVIEWGSTRRRCARDATIRYGAVPLCWQHAEGVRRDLQQDRILVELHGEIARLEEQQTQLLTDALGTWHDLAAKQRARDGRVYFARRPNDPSRIKIGYTTSVPRRMATLRLELIAAIHGSPADETEHHRRFADLRIEGEWFRADPTLVSYIATLGKAA